MTALLELVRRHAERQDGPHAPSAIVPTPLPGLDVVRATAPSGLVHAIARPLVCLVLQGEKRVAAGKRTLDFGAGDTLLVTADVPTVNQITQASDGAPYLALIQELDLGVITELASQMEVVAPIDASPVRVEPTDVEVADAALRLMRLVDRPAALPLLQAPILRELHYWLLAGRHGAAIRRLGWPESHTKGIARAVALLRSDFALPLPVDRLAAVAGMSVSSFHPHFRAATSLSPLQFQKQLRLIEARRLMLAEGRTASGAAFAVGYESVPHFTREYGRFFGSSPARDANAARRTGRHPAPVAA